MKKNKFYILLIMIVSNMATYAQSGILDTSFGDNGIATAIISGPDNYGEAVAVQPDGKIIVAGQAGDYTNYKVAVARFNTDGTLDNSFGDSGTLLITVGSARSYARGVAIQEDGKIVIGAYTYDDITSRYALVRINADGTLDNSFGNNGIILADAGINDVAGAMTILNDGKILLAGSSDNNFSAGRFNTDGSLDTSFGTNGWITTVFDAGDSYGYVKDVTSQNDGKILLGGYIATASARYRMAAARFNADGTIDTTFGTSGQLSFNVGDKDDYALAIGIQTDGKIMMGGYTIVETNPFKYDFAAVRLNTDGSFDENYGNNGVVTAAPIEGGINQAEDMLIQPDDKVVLVGPATIEWDDDIDMAMVRFNTDGNVDTAFGNNGKVITDVNGKEDYSMAVAIQPDNKIVLAGYSYSTATDISEVLVTRYENNILGTNDNRNTVFSLYPNPASDQITIELEDLSSIHQLEIFDVLGREVLVSEIQKAKNINVSALASGSYLLKLHSGNKTSVARFVKQ